MALDVNRRRLYGTVVDVVDDEFVNPMVLTLLLVVVLARFTEPTIL